MDDKYMYIFNYDAKNNPFVGKIISWIIVLKNQDLKFQKFLSQLMSKI